jgi:hypothetical protein
LPATSIRARERRRSPLRLEYRLTKSGKALYEIELALVSWACRWLGADPRDRPRHRCGRPAELVYRCRGCGEVVKPTDVNVYPAAHTITSSTSRVATPSSRRRAYRSTPR